MTHPEDLLAGYVDGTLGDTERAVVDAHLQACGTCRDEVELSRAAVTALASLEEVPVPFGVTGPVLAEAGRRFERRRAATWGRLQWVAGAAAAAALVLVVALNVNLGGGARDEAGSGAIAADAGATGATGGAAAEATTIAGLERQPDVNYDDAGVHSLASEAASERATMAAPDAGGEDTGLQVTPSGPALECLRAAGAPVDEPTTDQLVRLIEAKFKETPAYFAVFLEGPGAGQTPDKAVVWVVSKGDCQILNAVQQRL